MNTFKIWAEVLLPMLNPVEVCLPAISSKPGVVERGRPSRNGVGRRTLKIFSKRTEADGGRTSFVRLKDEFRQRTKFLKKRTPDEGRPNSNSSRSCFICLNDLRQIYYFHTRISALFTCMI